MTPSQAKRERADLLKAIAREEKKRDRGRLVALRGRARALRAARVRAIADARRTCRARRGQLPTLKEAAAMLRAARAEARGACDVARAKGDKAKIEAARAKAERDAERSHQASMRLLARHAKERAGQLRPSLAKGKTRRDESDDEVRGNIPPELVYLFERVKRQIKGGPRTTRTEAFLHYAEEHPDEELAAIEDKTDALIRELEERERRANPKKKRSPKRAAMLKRRAAQRRRAKTRPPTAEELAAVGEGPKMNPRRPPRAWWDDCIARLELAGRMGRKVRVPQAVCGAAWWRLSPQRRAAIVRKLEGQKDARARGAALALARAESRRRRDNPGACGAALERRPNPPREVVSLVYLEQKPGDREPYEYEHEFEGDRPKLEMRGGKAQLRGGTYISRDGWLEG